MSEVVVIGGGAAGMMAAVAASSLGHTVTLLEQNEKLGKKIYITGKGRCNFTNAASMDDMRQAVVSNDKFLYSAFYAFSNEAVMDFFEQAGMPYKIERGNRVFPVSDHASDVIRALERRMKEQEVCVRLRTGVKRILMKEQEILGVELRTGEPLLCPNVILATGGCSYPSTGSTGDGYVFAEQIGHQVLSQRPALVPLVAKESYIAAMQGLSLKNINLSLYHGNDRIYEGFGEMMFTHFGVTGPVVLSASSYVSRFLPGELKAVLDLKPALSEDTLNERLLREFREHPNAQIKTLYQHLLPSKMIPIMIELTKIAEDRVANGVTREERQRMIRGMKEFCFTITDTRGFREAIITQGGIDVKEIDPSSMESKRVRGLYFAGEVMDLDALTGGFNLQIAWSTGYLAGISIR